MIIHNIDEYISTYKSLKRDFKLRSSNNYVEFVTANGNKLFYNKSNKFSKGLYLFNLVKRDVFNYLEECGEVEPYEELPVNHHNPEYDLKTKTIGIDINNAYWSVAYLKGYISENTYLKGISKKEFKPIRLSALSTLGKGKVYRVYKDGKYSHDEVHHLDERLQDIYDDIRYTTFGVMRECAELLQDDFCCWKTDCIFFKDTKENRKKVTDLLENFGLECKVE